MSSVVGLLTGLFAAVMASILCVGYAYLSRVARRDGAPGESAPPSQAENNNGAALHSEGTLLTRTFAAVGESVPGKKDSESLRKRLSMAGYRWPAAATVFHGIRVASALGLAGAVGWVVLIFHGDSESALVPALCAAAFGFMLPDRVLQARVRARARRIRRGLLPVIDLLVLTLEAGRSLDHAMHDVARALANSFPDICEEFMFFHLEVRAGKSREEALANLAERSPDPELKKMIGVLLDGDRFGVSLGPALRTHGRYLRIRVRQRAQEEARKLAVKMTIPTFLLIFPAVLVVTLGPAYLQLKESLGRLLDAW